MVLGRKRIGVWIALGCLLAILVANWAMAWPISEPPSGPKIRMQADTFDPLAEGRALSLAGSEDQQEPQQSRHYIVQFVGPIRKTWKKELENRGITLGGYIPDYAFKVKMTPALATEVAELEMVRWVGAFLPEYKLAPGLIDSKDTNLTRGKLAWYSVKLVPEADLNKVTAQIKALDGLILDADPERFMITLDAAHLTDLAANAEITWIEQFHPPTLFNDVAAGEMRAPPAWNGGWTGAGQIVCITDSGIDTGQDNPGVNGDIHLDFDNRLSHISSWPVPPHLDRYVNNPGGDDGPADLSSGHGTHVAGSVGGSGARSNGTHKGIAHGATLAFQAVEQYVDFNLLGEMAGASDGYGLWGLPNDLNELFNEAYRWGARVHTNSWGNGLYQGDYTDASQQVDTFTWSHKDMTVLFAAGNKGRDGDQDGIVDEGSATAPGTAKNALTIGACENQRPHPAPNANSASYGGWWPADFPVHPLDDDPMADAGAQGMVAFSGRGPTDDGRIKPDVVAPGTWVLSTRVGIQPENEHNVRWGQPPNAHYMYLGGTSMATPLVAGASAVVRQFYVQGQGHTSPSGALVKATLINTARPVAGQYPASHDNAGTIPNNHQGWGVVDLTAATNGQRIRFQDQNYPLNTGQSQSFTVTPGASNIPLKVTVAWHDYPATLGTAVHLVNDLDLEVVAPDGARYYGNVFQNGHSITGGSPDRKNNVECVYIAEPTPGTYQVNVLAHNVPQGPQPFALVMTADWRAPFPTATPTATATSTRVVADTATPTNTATPTQVPPTGTPTATETINPYPVPPSKTPTATATWAHRLSLPMIIKISPPPPTPTPTASPIPTETSTPTASPTVTATLPATAWETLFSEDFEGNFPAGWLVFDNSGDPYVQYFWGKRNCRAYQGEYAGWAIGGGEDGSSLTCGAPYAHNAASWMIYGPFTLAEAQAAKVRYEHWLNSETNFDALFCGASKDGQQFHGYSIWGNSEGWSPRVFDLSTVPTLGDLTGASNVWLAFVFDSDSSLSYPEGAYVDNIVLRQCRGTTCSDQATARSEYVPAGLQIEPATRTLKVRGR